ACAGAAPAPDGPLDCWPPRRHLRPVAAPPPAWPWPHRFPRTQTSASLLNWTGEHSCWPTLVQCELLTRSTVRAWQEVGVRAPWLLHVLHGTPACRRPALRSRLHPRAKRRHKRLEPRWKPRGSCAGAETRSARQAAASRRAPRDIRGSFDGDRG